MDNFYVTDRLVEIHQEEIARLAARAQLIAAARGERGNALRRRLGGLLVQAGQWLMAHRGAAVDGRRVDH